MEEDFRLSLSQRQEADPSSDRLAVGPGYADNSDFDEEGSGSGKRRLILLAAAVTGLAIFGGVGGARRDTTSVVRVPVGIGAGYRFAIGATRSVSAYAAPFFVWSRLSEKGFRSQGDNAMRGSAAVDLVLTRNIGLTAGYEFGGKLSESAFGGTSGVFGAAVSYAFR